MLFGTRFPELGYDQLENLHATYGLSRKLVNAVGFMWTLWRASKRMKAVANDYPRLRYVTELFVWIVYNVLGTAGRKSLCLDEKPIPDSRTIYTRLDMEQPAYVELWRAHIFHRYGDHLCWKWSC